MKIKEILSEQIHNFEIGNSIFVRLMINPSAVQITGYCDRMLIPLYRNNCDVDCLSMKGIIDKDGTSYLWDDHQAVHQHVIKEMGLDEFKITTFECGFGMNGCFFRQGGGGWGGRILQCAGPVEESPFYPTLQKGLERARLKMVEFRNSVDPDSLY